MKRTSVAAPEIRVVTHDVGFGVALAVLLRGTPYALTVAKSCGSPLISVALHGTPPAAAVVELTGTETVVELRDLFRIWPNTRCLFVVRTMPLNATLARIVKHHNGAILSMEESPIVITATLIAMLSGPPPSEDA